jgi:hypothetical protein
VTNIKSQIKLVMLIWYVHCCCSFYQQNITIKNVTLVNVKGVLSCNAFLIHRNKQINKIKTTKNVTLVNVKVVLSRNAFLIHRNKHINKIKTTKDVTLVNVKVVLSCNAFLIHRNKHRIKIKNLVLKTSKAYNPPYIKNWRFSSLISMNWRIFWSCRGNFFNITRRNQKNISARKTVKLKIYKCKTYIFLFVTLS